MIFATTRHKTFPFLYFKMSKIVENIGSHTVQLDNVKGVFSDIGTIINLFLASLWGLPVSTTHMKTMSIIALGGESTNKESVMSIFKAWIWTFPVCFALSYVIAKILIVMLNFD